MADLFSGVSKKEQAKRKQELAQEVLAGRATLPTGYSLMKGASRTYS